jgi:hypothetical protein
MWTVDEGLPGADQRIRAMTHASSSFRGTREAREPGIHTPQHQKPNERRATHFNWAYGFRVRPCGPPRNDGLFDMGLGDAASMDSGSARFRERPGMTTPRG